MTAVNVIEVVKVETGEVFQAERVAHSDRTIRVVVFGTKKMFEMKRVDTNDAYVGFLDNVRYAHLPEVIEEEAVEEVNEE